MCKSELDRVAHLADVGVAGADVDEVVTILCSSGGEIGAVLVG